MKKISFNHVVLVFASSSVGKYFFTFLLLFGTLIPVSYAACPSVPTASRFSYSANGAEVIDSKTGLIWQRCSLGQTWSGGTCTGSASSYTHEQALSQAKTIATTTAVAWRLPNVKELASIADKGCKNPAIDATAFPNIFGNWYWTASPYVGDSSRAWFVLFDSGSVSNFDRSNSGVQVRLVRASQ